MLCLSIANLVIQSAGRRTKHEDRSYFSDAVYISDDRMAGLRRATMTNIVFKFELVSALQNECS